MNYDAEKHHRRSIRLAGYDYRAAGAYFVTICSHQKKRVFGRVLDGEMQMHVYGRIVAECWDEITDHYPQVIVDEWIVMPNHCHGILIIVDAPVGARYISPLHAASRIGAPAGSLGSVIGKFKAAATRRINAHRAERNLSPAVVWQRNFYERIIRDEKELIATRRYIIENPLHWEQDTENQHV